MELQFLHILLNPHLPSQSEQVQSTRFASVHDTAEDEDLHLFDVEALCIHFQLPHVVRLVVIEGGRLLDIAEAAEPHLLVTPLIQIHHNPLFSCGGSRCASHQAPALLV
jgi:hypothetical protein